MEPLESTSLHLVQSGIARLLNLLPNDLRDLSTARDTFNRLSEIEWRRIRDFLVLHYIANERVGEPLWDHCRAIPLPDTLAEKIALFRESGAFMREEDELFLDDDWGQVMLGQGIEPRGWSPLADNVPGADIGPFLDTLAKSCRVRAAALPEHRAFVAAMAGKAAQPAWISLRSWMLNDPVRSPRYPAGLGCAVAPGGARRSAKLSRPAAQRRGAIFPAARPVREWRH